MATKTPIYVTFIFKPAPIWQAQGHKTVRFAIQCDTMEQAREAAADVNGIDGLTHLYINKCGRIQKNVNLMLYGSVYEREITDIIHEAWNGKNKHCFNCGNWKGCHTDLSGLCKLHNIVCSRTHSCENHT